MNKIGLLACFLVDQENDFIIIDKNKFEQWTFAAH